MEQTGTPNNEHRGVVVVITNPVKDRFLLQMKDALHPVPACRGCLSFFGGEREKEDADTLLALSRELGEEITNPSIVRELVKRSQFWKEFSLEGNQFPMSYVCRVCVAQARNDEEFDRWAGEICAYGVVEEGVPVVLTAKTLHDRAKHTNLFVASLDVVFQTFMREYSA